MNFQHCFNNKKIKMNHPPELRRGRRQMEEVEVEWTHSPKIQEYGTIEFQEEGSAQCTCRGGTAHQKNWKHV